MQDCYPVRFSGPGVLLALPEIFSKQIINFEIDPKLYIDVDCDYVWDCSPFGHPMPVNIPQPHIVCKIKGKKSDKMQKFELKRWTDNEIVTRNLEELEQIYTAVQDGEMFILVCDKHAEVVNGSKLNELVVNGNITLSADLS